MDSESTDDSVLPLPFVPGNDLLKSQGQCVSKRPNIWCERAER